MSTILNFKYGFEINGISYGWHDKKLYRLPFKSGLRWYGLKEITRKEWGYTVGRKKIGINRLKQMTHEIDITIKIVSDNSMPF